MNTADESPSLPTMGVDMAADAVNNSHGMEEALGQKGKANAQQQQQQQRVPSDSLHLAAAVATAHRCLESILAREGVFTLPPNQVAQALFSPALVFTAASTSNSALTSDCTSAFLDPQKARRAQPHGTAPIRHGAYPSVSLGPTATEAGSSGVKWGLTEAAGVYVGCCSLIMAGLRHHAGAVRRCMALIGASTRALLKALMQWSQPMSRSAIVSVIQMPRWHTILAERHTSHSNSGSSVPFDEMMI